MDPTIQITDNELFEIIGRGQVELFAKDKELSAFRSQIEKVRPALVEAEALKTKNVALETSNKSLAEQNIKLDQALTEARKERDDLRVHLEARQQDVAKARADLDMTRTELARARENLVQTTEELERARSVRKGKK